MLMQLLQRQGLAANSAPGKLAVNELLDFVEKFDPDAACISVVSPSTVIQARYLCVKLKARFPQMKIVVGLWGMTQGVTDATKRLRNSGTNEVVTTLNDAVLQLAHHMPTRAEQMTPALIEEHASAHDLQHSSETSLSNRKRGAVRGRGSDPCRSGFEPENAGSLEGRTTPGDHKK